MIIHASPSDRIFSVFLLLLLLFIFSWGCNFVNQVLSILILPLVPVLLTEAHTHTPVFVKGLVTIAAIAVCFVSSIFSGSFRPPPRGSLYGSWRRPRLCSRRDSCACRSTGGGHRTDYHSDSRTLEAQRLGGQSWSTWAEQLPWTGDVLLNLMIFGGNLIWTGSRTSIVCRMELQNTIRGTRG